MLTFDELIFFGMALVLAIGYGKRRSVGLAIDRAIDRLRRSPPPS